MRRSRSFGLALLSIAAAAAVVLVVLVSVLTPGPSRAARASLPSIAAPAPTSTASELATPSAASTGASGLPAALLAPLLQVVDASSPGHFTSAEITPQNGAGGSLPLHVVGGIVQAADSKNVSIKPNAGGATETYSIDASTSVADGPNRADALDLTWNTPVVVVTQPNSEQAVAIVALSVLGGPATPAATPAPRRRLPTIRPSATPTATPVPR